LSPSLIFTWTRTWSPGLKTGRSVRCNCEVTFANIGWIDMTEPLRELCGRDEREPGISERHRQQNAPETLAEVFIVQQHAAEPETRHCGSNAEVLYVYQTSELYR